MAALTPEQITAFLLLILGALVWGAILAVVLVPERRAFVAMIGRAFVKRYLAFRIDWAAIEDARYVNNEDDDDDTRDGTEYLVSPDTYQVEPASIARDDTSMVLPDDLAAVQHLARLTRPNGLHFYSANKIADITPLNRNEVLAIVREVRGTAVKPAPDSYAFEKSGSREHYDRVGVNPLR